MIVMTLFARMGCLALAACGTVHGAGAGTCLDHPRLFFTTQDLPRLRGLRARGPHARIWKNMAASADWCLGKQPRTEWIAPVSPDPVYLNLYDRFYAMMHDMAIMEHLAFAYAYSDDDRYFDGARRWSLACCRVWRREADGKEDASKAYAVTRILKGLAVSYDLLHSKLSKDERRETRRMLLDVGRKYYRYFQNPAIAGKGHNKHHGSVEAASFGVVALALLGEVPEARDWLDLMIEKHTDYLLPHGLTAGGTQEQSSNFWAWTMQYRLFFMDALRRVTGRDLFREYAKHMTGRIALAAVAGPKRHGHNEDQQSILFGPSYGQLDYWSPVLVALAHEYARPIYQYLALWDPSLGAIQRTRYVTTNGEQLLFHMGGYAYAWLDPAVPAEREAGLPLSFEFPEVGEAYMRAGYRVGDIVVGVRQGNVVVHAGGRPVLITHHHAHRQPKPPRDLVLTDDGTTGIIRCTGADGSAFTRQTVKLKRPDLLLISYATANDVRWWCHGRPTRNGNILTWPDRTRLRVTRGSITSLDPDGYRDEKVVGMGKLKLVDPMPMRYPLIAARPDNGELQVEVSVGGHLPDRLRPFKRGRE